MHYEGDSDRRAQTLHQRYPFKKHQKQQQATPIPFIYL